MKNKFSKILLSSLWLLFVLLLPSCKNNDATAPNTIKFWHFWSEPNQKQALLELISEFEKENACTVELTELSWNDGKTKLIAAFNSGVSPDVLELGSDWIAQFSSTGVLAEINAPNSKETDTLDFNKFLEYSIPPAIWEEKYYAVSWIVDTRVMFYNKKLLTEAGINEPPQNYADLIRYSNLINNPSKEIYGFGTNGSDPHRLYKKILPIMWSYGGDIFDEQGRPVLNSLNNTEALNTFLQLSQTGVIETQRQLDAYFAQGKIGFVFSGAWLIEKIKHENPRLDFGVALMPAVNNGKNGHSVKEGVSFLGCEYLSLSSKSQKKELALKLIKFLTAGENAVELSKKFAEGGFPADKEYFKDDFFIKDINKAVFAKQLEYSKSTPVNPHWLDIEAIIENAVSQVLYGEMDAFNALNNAQVEILKLLNIEPN